MDGTANKQNRNVTHWKRVGRIVAKTVLFVILFLLIIVLLLQTGPVQNFLRKKAVVYLENKLKTRVEVGRVYVGCPKNIVLENIYVEDKQKDTLLAGGSVRANLDLLKLLFKNIVNIQSIAFDNITAKIKRQLPDTVFNFQFVVDAFADTAVKATIDTSLYFVSIPSLELNKIHLVYNDVITGSDMDARIDHLEATNDTMDLEHLYFDVPKTDINGLTARIYQVKPLATPDPEIKDIIEAKQPSSMHLDFKEANLQNVRLDYR